jgi:hypothetical protein
MKYLKFTRPDGRPVWLLASEPPIRITEPIGQKGNADLSFAGFAEQTKELIEDVIKAYTEATL